LLQSEFALSWLKAALQSFSSRLIMLKGKTANKCPQMVNSKVFANAILSVSFTNNNLALKDNWWIIGNRRKLNAI
jgi:hypothetical protein